MLDIKTPTMKTKIIILSLLTAFLGSQMQAQSGTRVNAVNNDISDNLDLRAVADIFGASKDLGDFERRLNDPEFQISNLDLNDDNEVDYLRVIETVEGNVHVVIIQSVLARDVYQDVATIDIERTRSSNIQVQIVGNEYMYGPNYIYEPVYYRTPVIYASFWSVNYRPYVSNWYWNYYPRYYTAWNPYPVFRYRNNININLNFNNSYNYVSNRRSSHAVVVYNRGRSNGYERQHPDYSFSRRNATVVNRYELDQRRGTRSSTTYSRGNTSTRREIASRGTGRDYSENRGATTRSTSTQRGTVQRNGNQRDVSSTGRNNQTNSSSANSRDYSTTRGNSSNDRSSRSLGEQTNSRQSTGNNTRQTPTQNTERSATPQRDYTQRSNASRETRTQSTERSAAPQRDYSENRGSSSRQSEQQRSAPQRPSATERSSQRSNAPTQRTEVQQSKPQGRGNGGNSRTVNRNT
jgi:hypothetical protein